VGLVLVVDGMNVNDALVLQLQEKRMLDSTRHTPGREDVDQRDLALEVRGRKTQLPTPHGPQGEVRNGLAENRRRQLRGIAPQPEAELRAMPAKTTPGTTKNRRRDTYPGRGDASEVGSVMAILHHLCRPPSAMSFDARRGHHAAGLVLEDVAVDH